MSKKRRQQVMLALLALVFVVLLGRQLGSVFTESGFGAPGGRSSGGRRAGTGTEDWREKLPQVEELRLTALDEATEALHEGRDPFQIRRAAPPPPRPEPSESDIRKRIEEARMRQQIATPAPVRPQAPMPPPIDVVYLGSFGHGRVRLAVFTDGDDIYNVPEGDVLNDKFVVVKIGLESADLGFVGFPDAPAKRLEIGG